MYNSNGKLKLALGFIVPNLVAFVLMGLTGLLNIQSGYFAFSEFIIVPMLMGLISAWFWKDAESRTGMRTLYLFINAILAALLSAVFLGEGYICLLIASP